MLRGGAHGIYCAKACAFEIAERENSQSGSDLATLYSNVAANIIAPVVIKRVYIGQLVAEDLAPEVPET